MLRFLSIRYQFVALMMVLAVTLIFAYTAVMYFLERERYIDVSVQEIEVLSQALEHDYAELILLAPPTSKREIVRKWRLFPNILQADIELPSGESIMHFNSRDTKHERVQLSVNKSAGITHRPLQFNYPVISVGKQVGWVRYIVSTEHHQALVSKLMSSLLVSIPVAMLLAIGLTCYLQRVFVNPMRDIMLNISTTVERQDYARSIVVNSRDRSEFAGLSRSFNALLTRVQSSLEAAKKSQAYAQELAHYDELTGLANRRLLIEHMEYMLDLASRDKRHGALLFIDLDNFKTLNDSRGHAAGDDLLKQVAASLKSIFRKEDTVARLGGDEFVILSGRLEDSEEAVANQIHSLMLKLRHVLSEIFIVQGEVYHLTASIGITTFPGLANSSSELMKQADAAMYQAKEAGRDGYRFYQPEMQAAADARLHIERALRYAITAGEFELFYQPQVDEFGRILGAEALLRWFKTGGEMVSPADFIPVAELTGLILPIGDWVLRRGFVQLKQWIDEGVNEGFNVSINISPLQFQQDVFVANIKDLLFEIGVPASSITLEVTEGIAISDIQSTVDKMNELREIGFNVSMDDFGTGYSSLTYLKKLPLNELKIDQSFVRDLDVDKADAELASTIIAMAKNLNLEVVAEGVEKDSQLRFLCRHGCTVFQGYYFYKPMRAEDLSELLLGNLIII